MKYGSMLVASVLVLGPFTLATADPVQWPVNSHYYEIITIDLTWSAARDLAASMYWNADSGHLATITSSEEQTFLQQSFGDQMDNCWLGGYQEPQSSPPADNWHWVTAEPWNYTNWRPAGLPEDSPGEPNDYFGPGSESWIEVHGLANQTWNDYGPEASPRPKFVVEYEAALVPIQQATWGGLKALFR